MNRDFNNKKVFVTGADGFIGSHLVNQLVRCGATVKALVYYNSWNHIGWLHDLDKEILDDIEIINGDIRDSFFINESVKGANYVFHLSSLIGIPYSYIAAKSYVDTNIHGALNIAQACLDLDSLDCLLNISTSEVYGSAQFVPMSEDHPLVGQSPYAATKIAADKIIQSFHLSFDLPAVIARPFNTYGPRQTARAVIPTIINQALLSETLKLGNLDARRDFNYVSDTADGMLALSQSDKAIGKEINIGTGRSYSIREITELVSKILGLELNIETEEDRVRPEKSEVTELLCDNSVILSNTNWKPLIDIETGLIKTIDWIDQNKEKFSEKVYSI